MAEPPETLGPQTLPGVVDPEAATRQPGASPGTQATLPGFGDETRPGTGHGQHVSPRPVEPGHQIGRFVVERRLGAGAMGVVLLAHDPDLERSVAIKLLRVEGEHGRARLRREAQAVAKIQHPNVIAVHEVGTHDEQVYVVMEYVDGGTLRDWIEAESRPWQTIVEVYRQAGRGLQAAHRAGLVHRDFKPDNVLISRGGRVRVTDFGIVGVAGSGPAETTLDDLEVSLDHASARLTRTGAVVGTPAYMPPEQYRADVVDARSDQFAFCVSLFEALYGERPHQGDTVGAILQSMQSGEVRAPTRTDVPPEIVDAVMRGLRSDPDERHPSMGALLVALSPKVAASRWRWVAAGAGVIGVGVGAYALGGAAEDAVAPAFDCGDPQTEYGAVWGTEQKTVLEAAFERRGPAALAAYGRVAEALDVRADAWARGVESACRARETGSDGQAVYALRRACLDDALRATSTFIDVLSDGEGNLVDGALSSVSLLRRVERCADVDVLKSAIWPTDAQLEALAPIEADLARARLMLLAGQHHETVKLATELEVRARAVGFDVTHAAVLETLARAEMQSGRLNEAEAHAREATTLAAKARDTSVEARAAGTLMFVVGPGLGRGTEALGMLPAGESAAARTRDPRARSYFKAAEAVVRRQNGDQVGAEKAAEEVITILEGLERPPPDELANAYSNRAGLAVGRGDLEAARRDQRRALEIAEQGLGKQHPLYAAYALMLGATLANEGEYEEALVWDRAALEAWEAALGPNHTSCALALTYIGIAQRMLGRWDEAGASFDDGLRRLDASAQDDPANRISLLDNRAHVAFRRGEFQAAEAGYLAARDVALALGGSKDPRVPEYDQAAAAMVQAHGDLEGALGRFQDAKTALIGIHGPKHQQVAGGAVLIADVLRELERCEPAGAEYREVFRIYNDLDLAPDGTLARAVAGQAACELERGDVESARQSFARAGDLLESLTLEDDLVAHIEFVLAKGKLAAGDRVEAERLSSRVLAHYESRGPGWAMPLADVRAWRERNGL